jgi:mono/diheme cytochrome c family protein
VIRRGASTLALLLPLGTVDAGLAADVPTGEGERLYRVHCLACHGETGKGDGPMRAQLEMSVPDLTTLSGRHEGEFPAERVHQIIDGRHETPAHGSREMPVWGFTFQSSGRDTDQEGEVQEMISALSLYLRSLQPETDSKKE